MHNPINNLYSPIYDSLFSISASKKLCCVQNSFSLASNLGRTYEHKAMCQIS